LLELLKIEKINKKKYMKKIGLLVGIIFSISNLFAQELRNTMYTTKCGTLSCEIIQKINVVEKDTIYYLYSSFQNVQYSSIVDIGGDFCMGRGKIEKLLVDLTKLVELYNQNNEYDFEVVSCTARFVLYKGSIIVYDKKKFTGLKIKNINQYIVWLNEVLLDKNIK